MSNDNLANKHMRQKQPPGELELLGGCTFTAY